MRHRVFKNHLGRNTKQARALYRSLVSAVLDRGRIETTLAKAKAVRGEIDKAINLSQKNPARKSGHSRIIRLGKRFSDTAEMVILELVDRPESVVEKPVEEPKKKVIRKKKNANKTV